MNSNIFLYLLFVVAVAAFTPKQTVSHQGFVTRMGLTMKGGNKSGGSPNQSGKCNTYFLDMIIDLLHERN